MYGRGRSQTSYVVKSWVKGCDHSCIASVLWFCVAFLVPVVACLFLKMFSTCLPISRAPAGSITGENPPGEERRAGAEAQEAAGVCRGDTGHESGQCCDNAMDPIPL